MTANDILFHPSALGKIMSGVKKGWPVEKSITCQKELVKMFRNSIYGRDYSFTGERTEKGIYQEEDAITLFSRVKRKRYTKNTQRLANDYFTGEFDLINADETVDIKCPWNLNTFPHPAVDEADEDYVYQGLAYNDLTGKRRHIIAYCLVNAPFFMVLKEQEKLFYSMGSPDIDSPHFERYLRQKAEVEKNMIFDYDQFLRDNSNYDFICSKEQIDIPMQDRVVEYVSDFSESRLSEIKSRIDECREWMNANLFKLNETIPIV